MKGFLEIKKVKLPKQCIIKAYKHMRDAGTRGLEGVALFAGRENSEVFEVQETIIPKQTSLRLEQGLLYSVGGDELYRINVWLYENNMTLFAQIHSHPGRAYHSDTDDAYPIVATVGGISIVVPNFASGPMDSDLWAVYRLTEDNFWGELKTEEVKDLIEITY